MLYALGPPPASKVHAAVGVGVGDLRRLRLGFGVGGLEVGVGGLEVGVGGLEVGVGVEGLEVRRLLQGWPQFVDNGMTEQCVDDGMAERSVDDDMTGNSEPETWIPEPEIEPQTTKPETPNPRTKIVEALPSETGTP